MTVCVKNPETDSVAYFTYDRINSAVCTKCTRHKSEHIWRCRCCNARLKVSALGLPIKMHANTKYPGARLCCPTT